MPNRDGNSGLTSWKITSIISHTSEFLVAMLLVSFCLYQERGLLFFPHFIAPHDNYYFLFPVFFQFAEALINGHLALWNPYSHGGEVFYPLIVHAQLLDPFSWIIILIGKIFTQDLSILFHWNLFLHGQIFVLGCYYYFRRSTKFAWTRCLLLLVLELSSTNLSFWRQPGILYQAQWIPWILICFSGLYHSQGINVRYWLGLALFLALQMQSYWFTGVFTFLLLAVIATALCYRARFMKILLQFKLAINPLYLLFFVAYLGVASLPNIALMMKQAEWMSPMRAAVAEGKEMTGAPVLYETPVPSREGFAWIPYSEVANTGTFAQFTDYIQLVYSHGNRAIHKKAEAWGSTSEGWMYLGLLPLVIALIGVFYGKEDWKKNWLVLLVSLGLISLGPKFYFFRFIYYLFPPLWFLRHLHTLLPLVLICLMYFVTLGADTILENFLTHRTNLGFERTKLGRLFNLTLMLGLLIWIGYAAFNCRDRAPYLGWVCILLVLPALLIYYAFTRPSGHLLQEEDSKQLFLSFALLMITLDLGLSFKKASYLYQGQPSPVVGYDLDLKAHPAQAPGNRIPFSYLRYHSPPTDPLAEQAPRYLSVLSHTPSALSELWKPETPIFLNFETALTKKRWNSFILQKNYRQLIYSGIDPSVQKKLFTIGKSSFQWVPKATIVPDEKSAFSVLKLAPNNSTYVPLVLESKTPINAPRSSSEQVSEFEHFVTNYSYNRYTLETKSTQDGFLYWSDGYDPDWKVIIDGVGVELYKANIAFKAFPLSSGMHHIELTFRPKYFLLASAAYLSLIILTLIGIGIFETYSSLKNLVRLPLKKAAWV